MSKRLAVLTSVGMVFALLLTGCQKDKDDEENLIGRWVGSKLTIKGVTWSPLNPSVISPGGQTVITPSMVTQLSPGSRVNVTLQFNKDKTLVAAVDAVIPGQQPVAQSATATWSASGDKLTITYRDASGTYTGNFVYSASSSKLTIEITNQELRRLLTEFGADLSQIPPAYRDLVNTLSGSAEFTK